MTVDQMRAQLGLGPEVSDAAVVDAWVQALYGMPAAEEPVSLAQVRQQLGMLPDDPTDQDANIESMIRAARVLVEAETGLILTRRQIVEGASSFLDLRMAAWPVASVDAITYVDTTETEQALASSSYRAIIGRRDARIMAASGGSLPAVGALGRSAITIVATAGFATPADVPEPAKRAILIMVSQWFRTREEWTMPQGVREMCQRIGRYS
jgi:uncharacterized phiE125 gp8 family phage protein